MAKIRWVTTDRELEDERRQSAKPDIDDNYDEWREDLEERIQDTLGNDRGLNADWSVSAWLLRSGVDRADMKSGTYLTDNEDGSYTVIYREWHHDTGEDFFEERETIEEEALPRWLYTNAPAYRK